MVLSTLVIVAAALTFTSHVTQTALLPRPMDTSTAPVMEDCGAEKLGGTMMILLTTVVSIPSGDYPLASSAVVTCARVVYASVSEDISTMDTMDDDTNAALDCLNEDNYCNLLM